MMHRVFDISPVWDAYFIFEASFVKPGSLGPPTGVGIVNL